MKGKHPISKPADRTSNDSPEDIDRACVTMDRAIDAVTDRDGYWSRRVQAAFEGAGFTIRHLQREDCHQSVWQVLLTCASCDLPRDKKAASTEIRRALRKNGVRISAGDLTVLDQRPGRLRCAFVFGPTGPLEDI